MDICSNQPVTGFGRVYINCHSSLLQKCWFLLDLKNRLLLSQKGHCPYHSNMLFAMQLTQKTSQRSIYAVLHVSRIYNLPKSEKERKL
jgi:hypothetical protein